MGCKRAAGQSNVLCGRYDPTDDQVRPLEHAQQGDEQGGEGGGGEVCGVEGCGSLVRNPNPKLTLEPLHLRFVLFRLFSSCSHVIN